MSVVLKTIVVCGQIILSSPPYAFKLDSITGVKTPLADGVYHTADPFCLYVIDKGIPSIKGDDNESN